AESAVGFGRGSPAADLGGFTPRRSLAPRFVGPPLLPGVRVPGCGGRTRRSGPGVLGKDGADRKQQSGVVTNEGGGSVTTLTIDLSVPPGLTRFLCQLRHATRTSTSAAGSVQRHLASLQTAWPLRTATCVCRAASFTVVSLESPIASTRSRPADTTGCSSLRSSTSPASLSTVCRTCGSSSWR